MQTILQGKSSLSTAAGHSICKLMKIGLISDVHAAPQPLAEALRLFRHESVDRIICPGDIAGYNNQLDETIKLLIDNQVECITGNHDQTFIHNHPELKHTESYHFLSCLPNTISFTQNNIDIYVVHAEPPDRQHGGIKLLDVAGNVIEQQRTHWQTALQYFAADILIVGHTHQVYSEQLGTTYVINPGSTAFNHSCMILTLPECKTRVYALEGKTINYAWNWGMLVKQ